MSSEQEILGLLPDHAVLSTFAHDTSSLMSCTDGERWKWTGDAVAEVGAGVDRDATLDEVVELMQARDGWTVKDGAAPDGARRIDLLHSDGTHLFVFFVDGPESLRVEGYSACFDFPEYEYGEKY
ncbi:hypothetical protein [Arthrobacter sp. SAFR-014]|uniref:hypothetical protein n=1 Tax=unclassified Arthrobacter TaxID=235627 RepID=UPI003F7BAA62